jgi:hypothetical protein
MMNRSISPLQVANSLFLLKGNRFADNDESLYFAGGKFTIL